MYNPFLISGKTILVTGASSGIGCSVAVECAKMGARVIITGRNTERLNKTFLQLEGSGHCKVQAEITDNDQLESLIEQVDALDGIVHSAGISKPLPYQFINSEEITNVFNPNFIAPVILTQKLIKKKKLKKNSSIVFISSISGVYCTSTGGAIYSASKGALNAISKTMALELAGKFIRVNCINPGMIDTAILDNSNLTSDQIQDEVRKYPLKRFGKTSEVAHAAIYLLSDASQWVTGTNLVIDGGYLIQ